MNKEQLARSQRRALGKGLSALLPTKQASAPEPEQLEEFHSIALEQIALDQIQPNEHQPRGSFNDEKLEELAQSIRANGVIQPIIISKIESGKYRIIAGERRWKAARLAGLSEIPALVRHVENDRRLELALIENIQREDLNPVEIATAFQRLAAEHGLSHEQIAEKTGKDRSTVANFVRLLRLSPEVLQALGNGSISVGHARALLNLTDPQMQKEACDQIISKRMSVRETEGLVKNLTSLGERGTAADQKDGPKVDPNIRAALDEMSAALGTRVRLIAKTGSSGRLEIEYYSQDDLDRIYSVIVK
ncbi:MAG: ParB/RepB/Spo0J family partition protein [Bryobacteraceae bacterium]